MSTSNNGMPNMPLGLRLFFGIFMPLVFVGVGLSLLFNWFNWIYDPSWNWLRWIGGPIFILYGFFRDYRLIKGNQTEEED